MDHIKEFLKYIPENREVKYTVNKSRMEFDKLSKTEYTETELLQMIDLRCMDVTPSHSKEFETLEEAEKYYNSIANCFTYRLSKYNNRLIIECDYIYLDIEIYNPDIDEFEFITVKENICF